MRSVMIAGLSMGTLLLVSCGPKTLALPEAPVDRAATCAVVSAAEARANAPTVKGDLDFASQTRIAHYAMLAGAEDKIFSTDKAQAVVKRMGEVEEQVTNGKWQDLIAPCGAAYPLVKKLDGVELPTDKFDAQLGCYAMADFLGRSVSTTDPKGETELASYGKMKRDLDGTIGSGLKARGAAKYEKTVELKNEALSHMTKLGAPIEVMKLCKAKYG
jgi:hypothetical protein